MITRLFGAPSVVILALASCGSPEPPPQPRLVILYVACTVNKSFLSPYAPEIDYTPSLRALAQESVVFQRHVAESGQSGIDFATIYTGTQADRHGIYYHPFYEDSEHAAMADKLARYKAALVAGFDAERADGVSEEETLECLRTLGYVR